MFIKLKFIKLTRSGSYPVRTWWMGLKIWQKLVIIAKSIILATIVRSSSAAYFLVCLRCTLQSCAVISWLTDTVRAGRMKTLDSNKDPCCAMSGEFSNVYVSETMKEQCWRVSILWIQTFKWCSESGVDNFDTKHSKDDSSTDSPENVRIWEIWKWRRKRRHMESKKGSNGNQVRWHHCSLLRSFLF